MKKRLLLMTLVVILMVGMVIGGCAKPAPTPAPTPAPPAPAKVYDWKLHTIFPAPMERMKFFERDYGKMVEEYTQGRIKLTMYAAPAIVPAAEVGDACVEGIVEMALFVGAYWAGKFPICNVEYGLPMVYQTREAIWELMWYRGLQDIMVEALATRGLHYLGFQVTTGTYLMGTKPIRTVDDLKGMKVRAIGAHADWVTKLGAGTVNIPMVELYMALKLGTIEAAITGIDVHSDLKHQEVAKYFMATPKVGPEPLCILVNLDQWQALPDDLKSIMTLVTRVYSHFMGITQEVARERRIIGTVFPAAGVEIIELSPEDTAKMVVVAEEIWDEWAAKDDYCARAVAIMKDYARERGRRTWLI